MEVIEHIHNDIAQFNDSDLLPIFINDECINIPLGIHISKFILEYNMVRIDRRSCLYNGVPHNKIDIVIHNTEIDTGTIMEYNINLVPLYILCEYTIFKNIKDGSIVLLPCVLCDIIRMDRDGFSMCNRRINPVVLLID